MTKQIVMMFVGNGSAGVARGPPLLVARVVRKTQRSLPLLVRSVSAAKTDPCLEP